MHELVDLAAVERLFNLMAVLLPVLGIGVGAAIQFGAQRLGALMAGIFIGLLGPANWLLWRIYNSIEDHYGLDSVKAMLLNLSLFVVLGLAVGIGIRVVRRSSPGDIAPRRPEHRNT
jgi:hypothetical protein